MTEFVDECRREWRRLGVPDAVAAEMAADLEADLEEAEAEGVSAEEVLGSGAFEPRSFAAAWAAERGVVGRPTRSPRRWAGIPAVVAALALVAIVGAVLTIEASSSTDRQSLAGFPPPPAAFSPLPAEGEPMVVIAAPEPRRIWAVEVDADESADVAGTVGSVLLIASLAGIVLFALSWLWLERRSRLDGRPTGPAY